MDEVDEIAELTDCTFKLHKLGPLYNFSSKSLDYWEEDVSKYLIRQLKLRDWEDDTIGMASDEKIKDELVGIRFDPFHIGSLNHYNSTIKPIKISIEIRYQDNKGRQTHTLFLMPSSYTPREDSAFVYYPLVLVKAPIDVLNQMVAWFDRRFFAKISRLTIPPDIMLSSIQIWVSSMLDLKKEFNDTVELIPADMTRRALQLDYTTADENLSDIQVKLSSDQAFSILDVVPQDLFYSTFCKHVKETTGILLWTVVLHRVSNALVTIRKDGLFKLHGHAYKVYAVQLLQTLIELAATQMY